jgi:hypothetical protein
MRFEIKNKFSGSVIFSLETESLKLAMVVAVKQKINLSRADLSGADLSGINLSGAKIKFHQYPSIRTLSSMTLENISDEIILELMRWDAQAHPEPELFDEWAKGGPCPYQNEERWWWMTENKEVWKAGKPTMKLSDLVLEICKQEGWKIRGYLK